MKKKPIFLLLPLLLLAFAPGKSQVTAAFSHHVLVDPDCVSPTAAAHIQLIGEATGPVASYRWSTDAPRVAQIAEGAHPQNPVLNILTQRGDMPTQVTVTLVVTDSTGNSDSLSQAIDTDFHFAPQVNFSPRFAVEACETYELQLTDMTNSPMGVSLTTYLWDLGNGEQASEPNASFSYTEPGDYTIGVTVTDENGCSSNSEDSGIFLELSILSPGECE